MKRAQVYFLNISLLVGILIFLTFAPVLEFSSVALFLIGFMWLYLFHKRPESFDKKLNLFSFFWFVQKTFNMIDMFRNKYIRESLAILIPLLLIVGLCSLLKSAQQVWPFIWGVTVFEIAFVVYYLINPSRSDKNL